MKDFVFLCVIDMFSKFAWVIPLKDKKALQLVMLFKISQMNRIVNQKNMDRKRQQILQQINEIMATKKMLQKCIQHITKENLLWLKDLLES